ncbi:MAG: hypothetical protein GXO42_00865 [bacterium]|nr:hypothetical protein [bacterium]
MQEISLPPRFIEAIEQLLDGRYLDKFTQLYEQGARLLEFWKRSVGWLKGQVVETAVKNFGEKVLQVFLGGIEEDENGKIKVADRAACEFYQTVFGIQVDKYNLFAKVKFKEELNEQIDVAATQFTNFISGLQDRLEKLLEQLGRKIELKFNDSELIQYLLEPQKLLQDIKEYLQLLLNMLPNYNTASFVLWSAMMLTYSYFSSIYPVFKEKNKFEQFCKLYGYSPYLVFPLNNKNLENELALYSYKNDSIGRLIIDIIWYIWTNWPMIYGLLAKYFVNLPSNPLLEYYNMLKQRILSTSPELFNVKIYESNYEISYSLPLNKTTYYIEFTIARRCLDGTLFVEATPRVSIVDAIMQLQYFIFGGYMILSKISVYNYDNKIHVYWEIYLKK